MSKIILKGSVCGGKSAIVERPVADRGLISVDGIRMLAGGVGDYARAGYRLVWQCYMPWSGTRSPVGNALNKQMSA